jgi:hypothetical protein
LTPSKLVIEVKKGSLKPEKVQELLDGINEELAKPNSETSKEASKLGLTVKDVEVDLDAPFVIETPVFELTTA